MNKQKLVIFDLDGTLSLPGDRLKCITGKKKYWDSFHMRCGEDAVNEPIAAIYRSMKRDGHKIKIVTGRSEAAREITLKWLRNNGLGILIEDLHMRGIGDHREDTDVKPELLADFIDDIFMIFEDRQRMVDLWRSMGIACVQVAPGDF